MEKDYNLAMISDLILLANADDKVTDSEYEFIVQLAERMDITPDEVDALFIDPVPSITLFTELERISHFYKMVLLMNVDLETHEKEILLVRNFGLKMGIRPGVIDQILLQMNKFEDKIIPSDDLVRIFQTYYN